MNAAHRIVVASDAGISIRSKADVSEAVGLCIGTAGLILTEADVAREFFDLRTGLAGELFQKFTNYKVRDAIGVADLVAYGERVGELARAHQRHELLRMVGTTGEATAWLEAAERRDRGG